MRRLNSVSATLVLIVLLPTTIVSERQAIEQLREIYTTTVSYPNPNEDGTFIEVDMGPPTSASYVPGAGTPPPDPLYLLFTAENPDPQRPIVLSITDKNRPKILEKAPNYNRDAPLKILCHGFQSSSKNPFPTLMMQAYLAEPRDEAPNVILVDWKSIASSINYRSAAGRTSFVGRKIADIIASLLAEGLTDLDKIHIIGHSLGAHVAGWVGSILANNASFGQIARITGMDPAGPNFCVGQDQRLDSSDAKFVDVIHTDDGNYCGSLFSSAYNLANARFGNDQQLGHVDFYPNGGSNQPGCSKLSACSHGRSYDLMRESITSRIGFPARQCSSWVKYDFGKCKDFDGDEVLMGEYTPTWVRGKYFLKTGKVGPYAVI